MPLDGFDWKNPDYATVFAQRALALGRIRENPERLPALKAYYREHPAQFITDWGCTFDPRNAEIGQPAVVPFILFPRQVEWIDWVMQLWRDRRSGANPKSRESGVSWLAIALATTLCLHHEGLAIGFGSRKEEYVDSISAPKALFWKARKFLEMLPAEFRGGYNPKRDAPYMRILFRGTDSVITGEAGDNIGRGDRASIFFVDEAAFLEHPEVTEASLSQTTNCQIDISTAHGTNNPFYRKVVGWPKDRVFFFHWKQDPRKDEAWYQEQVEKLDPVILAQEVDIDFAASLEGVLIPSAWVQSAVGAAEKLGIEISGARIAALDVADEGRDNNAWALAEGIQLEEIEEWSGAGSDIYQTTLKAFGLCDDHECDALRYDADGLGAGVRGDAATINHSFREPGQAITVTPFRGSGAVFEPDGEAFKGRKNADFFANAKAQAWWTLRRRFERTHRAVTQGIVASHDEMISISPGLKHLARLCVELSQPTYSLNSAGKIVVDKAPDGARSPNLADAVMMRFAPMQRELVVPAGLLKKMRQRNAMRQRKW